MIQPLQSMRKIPISRKQAEFLRSQAKYTLFCGGVGSGKTKAGTLWALREMCRGDGVGFIGANTYAQLCRVTLKDFLATLAENRIPYVLGSRPPASWGTSPFPKHDMILSAKTAAGMRQMVCSQLTNYDIALRGVELRWFWIDETRDTPKAAFEVLMGRLRGGSHDLTRCGAITTTPRGFNWLYDCFISNGESALTDRTVITATSNDNPWLPPGYVDDLLRNYNPRLAAQEVGGKFVSLAEGQAYAEFDRNKHIGEDYEYNSELPLIHTWDFNLNPLCSVIIQIDPKTGVVWCIDEIHIEKSARTRDATSEFIRRYGKHRGQVKVYGDRNGLNRHTASDSTDFTVIESEYLPVFGLNLSMEINYSSNYDVSDSVQDVNNLLENSRGQIRLRLRPECEFTIRDLEQVTYKPGSRSLDKGDTHDGGATLTHHTDALRYYVSFEHPARSNVARSVSVRNW